MPPETGKLHALLIGVDAYLTQPLLPDGSYYPPLGGCVRDIRHVEVYLLDRLGLNPSNILKLTASRGPGEAIPEPESKRPSYENMVASFKEVTNRATKGDRVYIHYSGHGGRSRTAFKELKGEDGLDEGLVPYDIATNGARYLRDIELAHLLRAMGEKELIVTFVADCCHSGGTTKGVSSATARGMVSAGAVDFDTRHPPQDSAVASLEALSATWSSVDRTVTRGATVIGDLVPGTKGFTLLAACRANELAYEDSFDGKEKNGALTYWMLDSLRSMQPETTYKVLHDRILAKIRSWMPRQTPELQGEGDRVAFGTDRIAPVYAIPILEVDASQEQVKLNAGEAHGLGVGSLLAAYPLGAVNLTAADTRKALLTVSELIGDSGSRARITKKLNESAIQAGDQAVLLGTTDLRLQRVIGVAIEDPAAQHRIESAVAEYGSGFIRLQQSNERVDFQVGIVPVPPVPFTAYEIWDGESHPIPNLRPPIPINDPDGACRVAQRLVHLAKYRQVQALDNPDPLGGKFKVEIIDVSTGKPLGSTAELAPGAQFKIRITNLMQPNPTDIDDPSRIINVTVLDLAPDWSIKQVHPDDAAAFELLQPGQTRDLPCEAYLPEGYEYVVDIFKVFATRRTTGFRCLELPALDQPSLPFTRGLWPEDALQSVLEAFTDDKAPEPVELATRQVKLLSKPNAQEQEWAVAEVRISVKNTV